MNINHLVEKIPERFRAIVFIAIIVVVGSTLLIITRAASSSGSTEAENGSLLSGASVVNDSTASGGKAVAFGSGQTGSTAYSFVSSGLTGGGFQNVIAVSPFKDGNGNRPYLLGADVSGINVSTNRGYSWVQHPGPTHVAGVLWSDATKGKAYAAADEGFFVTTNWGSSWTKKAGTVNFDGNGSYYVSGSEHPRPTGNLIAQETSGSTDYVWAATATQGVKQSTDDGATWSATTLAGNHMRSIAADPNNPDVVYLAIENVNTGSGSDPNSNPANTGIWRSTNARSSSMSFTKVANYPGSLNTPEELWAVDDNGTTRLYVAGGKDGVFEYSGSNWTTLNTGLATGSTGSTWESITAYRDITGSIIMYTGATATKAISGVTHGRTIMKSNDGGASWTSISDDPHITLNWNMYGTTEPSWLQQVAYHNFAANSQWTASYIAIDPDTPNIVLVAGRGGAWFGVQSGGTNTTWQPADNSLMVTVNMAVAVDPNIPSHVLVGNMDYTVLASQNNGASFVNNKPPAAQSTGDVVVFDANPAAGGGPTMAYLAASQRGQATGAGNIYSNPNPFSGGAWTDEALPVNSDIPALGVGHDASGSRVILAGVTNMGFWRKVGSTWSQITGGPFDGSSNAGSGYFAWKVNTPIVYALDSSGVWRSTSAGSQGSWVKLLSGSAGYASFNALALDPVNSNYLYVSNGVVKRITNAETAANASAVNVANISTVTNAGPIVISTGGELFIHDRGGNQLLESLNPRLSSPTFSKVSDAFYAENDGSIRSMAIGSDNYIYTADNGQGVTVGKP